MRVMGRMRLVPVGIAMAVGISMPVTLIRLAEQEVAEPAGPGRGRPLLVLGRAPEMLDARVDRRPRPRARAVAVALDRALELDLLLDAEDRLEERLGARRAAREVHVDRDDQVDA